MFRAIGLVLSWLPVIVSTIAAVEQIVGNGNGAEKKKIVSEAIYRILGKAGVQLSGPVKTIISAVIDGLVAVLNILGVAGFSDVKEGGSSAELLPAAYAQEIAEQEAEAEIPLEAPEPSVKATPDEERMDELQEILEARVEDSTAS